MKITKSDFGTLNTGENIYIYHMENANGAYVEVINFGCRLVKIVVPDRDGKMTDVCLGFDSMEDYATTPASAQLSAVLPIVSRTVISVWTARNTSLPSTTAPTICTAD